MRCSAALGHCHPSWLRVCRPLPAQPAGLTPLSLCPLCLDVSIFSLKEIQLQKDPGYRGSAFQQSGRTGENHADLSQMVPRTALALGSYSQWVLHRKKPNLIPDPCFSPQITPGASLLVTYRGTKVRSRCPEAQLPP